MLKQEIRKQFREKREQLGMPEASRLEDLLLIRFQQVTLPYLRVIHRYLPAAGRKEPDPGPLCRWLSFANPGLRELLPRVDTKSGEMTSIFFEETTRLVRNGWGIEEPVDGEEADPDIIDLVIVPLLAFDRSGHRVGYGKGFYDRLLSKCRPDCKRVGLSFFGPVDRIADLDRFDMKMNLCITPERVYEFQ